MKTKVLSFFLIVFLVITPLTFLHLPFAYAPVIPEAYVYCNNYVAGSWTNPTYAYNNNTANGASIAWSPVGYCAYLTLNLSSVAQGSKIRYWVGRSNTVITTMQIWIANQTGAWIQVYSATPTYGAYANATITFSQYSAMRFRFSKTGTASRTATVYETQAVNNSYTIPDDTYTLNLDCDKPFYYMKGDTINITATSNGSTSITLSIYWNWKTFSDNVLVYQNTQTANYSWLLSTINMNVGYYRIVANISSQTVTIWRTLFHLSDYSLSSLPFSYSWQNVNYTLEGRSLIAQSYDDVLNVTYPKIPTPYSVVFYVNNMTFQIRLTGSGWAVDILYMALYLGIKWTINGTLTTSGFEFQCLNNSGWTKYLNQWKSRQMLTFDWNDIALSGQSFFWDSTFNILNVTTTTTFSIDPYVFSDGFEGAPYSAWTGTVIGAGQTLVQSSTYAHHGVNSSKSITDGSGKAAYCYKDFTTATNNYLRFYVYISSDAGTAFLSFGGFFQTAMSSQELVGIGIIGSTRTINLFWTDDTWTDFNDASATTLATGTWHCLELYTHKSATVGELHVYLNGAELADLAHTGIKFNWALHRCAVGSTINQWRGAHTNYVDCVVYDTSYIGPESAGPTAYIVDLTKTFTIALTKAEQMAFHIITSQAITSAFVLEAIGNYKVLLSESITNGFIFNALTGYHIILSEGITSGFLFSALTNYNVILTEATSLGLLFNSLSNYNVILTQGTTLGLSSLTSLVYYVTLTYATTLTLINYLQTNFNVILTQSFNSGFLFTALTNYNLILTQLTTIGFTQFAALVYYVTLSLSPNLAMLQHLQTTFNVILSQTINPTLTTLLHTAFNVMLQSTWTTGLLSYAVNATTITAYIVDLALTTNLVMTQLFRTAFNLLLSGTFQFELDLPALYPGIPSIPGTPTKPGGGAWITTTPGKAIVGTIIVCIIIISLLGYAKTKDEEGRERHGKRRRRPTFRKKPRLEPRRKFPQPERKFPQPKET